MKRERGEVKGREGRNTLRTPCCKFLATQMDVGAPRSEDPKLIVRVTIFQVTQTAWSRDTLTLQTDGRTDGRTDNLRWQYTALWQRYDSSDEISSIISRDQRHVTVASQRLSSSHSSCFDDTRQRTRGGFSRLLMRL